MLTEKAIEYAKRKGLDLVLVAPEADPPVCRIMDYGKYRYQQQKKEQRARKNQASNQIKEVRLSLTIGEHDLQIKLNKAKELLDHGHRVMLSLRLFGRQRGMVGNAIEVIKRAAERLDGAARLDGEPRAEGNTVSLLLNPIRRKKEEEK